MSYPNNLGNGARTETRRFRWRRRTIIVAVLAAPILVLGLYAAIQFLPAIDSAREVRTNLARAMRALNDVTKVDDRALDTAGGYVDAARDRFEHVRGVVAHDPLLGLLRGLPVTAQHVAGADRLVEAGDDVISAAERLLSAGEFLVAARNGEGDPLPRLFEAMQGAAPEVAAATTTLERARERLNAIPDGLIDPVAEARRDLAERIDEILPSLVAYADVLEYLPRVLGADEKRRYLVLALDPAEIRPTGGFAGTYGVVELHRGAIVHSDFNDVYTLDDQPGMPYVEPPADLKHHLLGDASWELADANWYADYPMSAKQALNLYTLESGDADIDGVIMLTTYAIDELLRLTGPIDMPEYDETVRSGEVLMTALLNTRKTDDDTGDRKQFLDDLADRLIDELKRVPTSKWDRAINVVETIRATRQAMVWLADPALQERVVQAGWDGGLRRDTGDFVMAVDSYVAPVGKLYAVITRELELDVQLDPVGNATNTLTVSWLNPIRDGSGREIEKLRTIARGREIFGNFMRVFVPERSRFVSVAGGSIAPVAALESHGTENGRDWFGAYLMVPAGRTDLTWQWTAPYPVQLEGDLARYRLVFQKQPGTRADPLRVTVRVPEGHEIVTASSGGSIAGGVASWTLDLSEDVELELTYSASATSDR